MPLLSLWTVRPVQSLSACTRMHFTLFTSKSVFISQISSQNCECILSLFVSTCVALRSQQVSGAGRSPAEIVSSNPTGGMDICLL